MLELIGYVLLALVLAVGLFLIATRLLPAGEQVAPPLRDEPLWTLPAGRALVADEVDAVRLPVALRGYRFAETDILLDRLAGELRARDAEIRRLRTIDTAPLDPPGPDTADVAAEPDPGAAEPDPGADPEADAGDHRPD